jgi:peptidoglycan/LPS O-acetylase OafA/YrhL
VLPTITPLAARPREERGIRREVQALRAVAVLGVLIYHLWPHRLTGGFVGVDVFFVISGFLISDHLMRDRERRGRILLVSFWARRARRLLPASLLVLAVTTLATYLLVPVTRWAQFGGEIITSAFYVENWSLAAQAVDYLGQANAPSPVQHFWTLGVEEQFYLAWPLLLIAGIALAVRVGRSARSGAAAAMVVVVVASFVYSVVFTFLNPSVAYFSTATRAWEFGAGALLALAAGSRRLAVPERIAAAASWSGFGLIAIAMLFFSAATPFPSYTALLPVVGTLAVILAGTPAARWAPTRLISLRPVQFVGDVSYGVYLWHWPLIVLIPFFTDAPLTTFQAISIGAVSIALGWLSKRFVEDPVRTHPWLAKGRPRRSLIGTAAAMSMVTVVALPLAVYQLPAAPAVPDAVPSCWGAQAMSDPECGGPLAASLRAPAASFASDLPPEDVRACEITVETSSFRRCDLVGVGDSGRHIALVGDSHATRWVPAFRDVAEERGWALSTYLVSGCALVSTAPVGGVWGYDPVGAQLCPLPTRTARDEIAADPEITDVVLTNRSRLYVSSNAADRPLSADDVAESIRIWQAAGKRVTVLVDPPEMHAVPQKGGGTAADCLMAHDARSCALPREQIGFADPMRAAAAQAGADVIDLTGSFCDAELCYSQIGGLVVYTDDNHLTRSFAETLTVPLGEALERSAG